MRIHSDRAQRNGEALQPHFPKQLWSASFSNWWVNAVIALANDTSNFTSTQNMFSQMPTVNRSVRTVGYVLAFVLFMCVSIDCTIIIVEDAKGMFLFHYTQKQTQNDTSVAYEQRTSSRCNGNGVLIVFMPSAGTSYLRKYGTMTCSRSSGTGHMQKWRLTQSKLETWR